MLRRSLLPLALMSLAGMLVGALLILAPVEQAKAPNAPQPTGVSQDQAQAEAEAAALTEAQAPTVTTQSVADGFQDRFVAEATGATALAFMPDDRLLVTDRTGRVRLNKPGSANTTVALDISGRVCSNSERGVLGVAVDPDFATNKHVYVYYTFKKYGLCPSNGSAQFDNPVNRVSRFVMDGDTIDPASEEVLIDNIPSPRGAHNAGDLHFGKDGKLYVSVGDGACDYAQPTRCQTENDASRDEHVLLGKILRVNPDGTIPADNPYADAPDGVRCGQLTTNNARGGSAAAPGNVCKETFAMGLRNPFRFAVDPDAPGTSLHINDVGGGRIEEVDEARFDGAADSPADYGWNCREGSLVLNTQAPCPAPNTVEPIHEYEHTTGCSSITGAAFVPESAGWSSSYRDAYLYGDYVCNKIFRLKPDGSGGFERTTFADGLADGGPVSMAFGPEGALYYTTYAGGGQVRRIINSGAPVAEIKATPTDPETGKTFGPTPLTVDFDASGSTDPQGDAITSYEWNFDYANGTFEPDPNASGATATRTYDTAGTYTAGLRATDSKGNSDIAKITVYAGNAGPPNPVIDPSIPKTFEVGQQITLKGSATDDSGQNVELEWEVIRHHTAPNEHTHPSILDSADSFGSSVTFPAPGPEDLGSTNPEGNYLEVRLTATDSQGLSKTVSRDLKPETTYVRFGTRPAKFFLYANGTRLRAPRALLSWEGYNLNVYAPAQRDRYGRSYVFRSWSDGRGARHTITTPENSATYVATFRLRKR